MFLLMKKIEKVCFLIVMVSKAKRELTPFFNKHKHKIKLPPRGKK